MGTLTREQWVRRRRLKRKLLRYGIIAGLALAVILILLLIVKLVSALFAPKENGMLEKAGAYPVTNKLLTVSKYSRSGTELKKVTNLVIHFSGTPGERALSRREYYEGLKDKKNATESMHFIVDTDGMILQLVPTNEIALASMSYNEFSISIEYCYLSTDGSMSADSYRALVSLSATLAKKYELSAKDIVRHYDVTGVNCPAFFVSHEDVWKQFQNDVKAVMNGTKVQDIVAPSQTPVKAPEDATSPAPTLTPTPEAGEDATA